MHYITSTFRMPRENENIAIDRRNKKGLAVKSKPKRHI